MKKISILLAVALMVVIYSCGNGKQGSNEQNADSLTSKTVKQSDNKQNQITLTVKSGEAINLAFNEDYPDIEVKIVSGNHDTTFILEPSYHKIQFTSGDTRMTIYGNIHQFFCSYNYERVTDIDLSKNTVLTNIDLFGNHLSSLDVSKNMSLTELNCSSNNITTLNLSKNTALTKLSCMDNKLTSLDLSNNRALKELICAGITVKVLDISKNTSLEKLNVGNKELTDLKFGNNKSLYEISCNEDVSNSCLEKILKSLPDRIGLKIGELYHVGNDFTEKIDERVNWKIVSEPKEF